MPALEIIALDTATPQLRAPGTGDTYTAPRTVGVSPSANTSALTVSSFSLTGANAQSMLDLAGTWNTSGTPTAIKLNVTDTASNAASNLLDLQVGGTSQFYVRKNAIVVLNNPTVVGNGGGTLSAGPSGFGTLQFGALSYGNNGLGSLRNTSFFVVRGGGGFAWENGANNPTTGTLDLILTRKAAANLQLGDGDAAAPVAQTLGVQSVVAGTTNTAGANFTIRGSQGTGTGAGGSIIFQTAPAGGSGTAQNALATALTIAATGTVTSSAAVVTGGDLYINGLSNVGLRSSGAGVLLISNASFNDFGRLQFGGTTSSFPALKRSSTSLIVRLADDSANAPLESASVKTDAPAGGTSGTWKLGVAATVSPTAPNRTIEVDIGGTIYYLHAKTTND